MRLHISLPMIMGLIMFAPNSAMAVDPFFPDPCETPGISCAHHHLNIDIHLQAIDDVLSDVIRCSGRNIMTTVKVTGKLSWHAQQLPAMDALTWIMSEYHLTLKKSTRSWVIMHDTKDIGHWHATHFHNADVHLIKSKMTAIIKLHPSLQWLEDNAHNTAWIHAADDTWHDIQPLLQQWDQHMVQVGIRALVLKVDQDTMRSLGAITQSQWQSNKASRGRGLSLTLPIAKLRWQQWLATTIDAAIHQGHGEMLSSPHVMTLNHHAAVIETGTEIPYTEKTLYGDTSTAFKKAVLKLSVTPHVYSKAHIQLDMTLSQDQVSPLEHDNTPSIQTRAIHSLVDLRDGQTILLGGIWQESLEKSENATPGLSRIPLLGALFTHQAKQKRQQQLVILITPTLVEASHS